MVNVDENWLAGARGAVGQGGQGGTQKGRSYKFLGRVAECHTICTDLCPHFMFKCKSSQNVQTFQFSSVSFLHYMDVPHICDILQLIFWVPNNNGDSEPNAEEVVDEVVEAEVLVLGAGMDVFLRHSWQFVTIFETQIIT